MIDLDLNSPAIVFVIEPDEGDKLPDIGTIEIRDVISLPEDGADREAFIANHPWHAFFVGTEMKLAAGVGRRGASSGYRGEESIVLTARDFDATLVSAIAQQLDVVIAFVQARGPEFTCAFCTGRIAGYFIEFDTILGRKRMQIWFDVIKSRTVKIA